VTATPPARESSVRITYEEGFGYAARHVETGVASQGETEAEALAALAEALALYHRDEDEARAPDEEWFDRFGVDPDATGDEPLPGFMQ
jgi:predicted RNase H-like HicB family nuclease